MNYVFSNYIIITALTIGLIVWLLFKFEERVIEFDAVDFVIFLETILSKF